MGSSSGARGVPRAWLLAAAAVGIVAGLLLGVLVGGPLLDPPDDGGPTPEPIRFDGVTESYDDRIVFRFRPDVEEPREYRVTYELRVNGSTTETVTDRPTTLSASEPLVVTVEDRRVNTPYALDMTIRYEGRTVHESRTVVSRQPPE